jgi:hypothetical protein
MSRARALRDPEGEEPMDPKRAIIVLAALVLVLALLSYSRDWVATTTPPSAHSSDPGNFGSSASGSSIGPHYARTRANV